jgi:amidase
LGHRIEPLDLDLSPLIEPFTVLWRCALTPCEVPLPLLDDFNQWLIGNAESVGDYLRAQTQLQLSARQLAHCLSPFDAVLLPTYLQTAQPIGGWDALSPEARLQAIIDWIAPCPIANATGLPAIALPTGLAKDGLPIGVQLLGRAASEGPLLQLAAQLERAIGWQQLPDLARG